MKYQNHRWHLHKTQKYSKHRLDREPNETQKSSFAKEYVKIADSYKPLLNKMMTTSV